MGNHIMRSILFVQLVLSPSLVLFLFLRCGLGLVQESLFFLFVITILIFFPLLSLFFITKSNLISLGGKYLVGPDQNLYCEQDFLELFAKTCTLCKGLIKGRAIPAASGL